MTTATRRGLLLGLGSSIQVVLLNPLRIKIDKVPWYGMDLASGPDLFSIYWVRPEWAAVQIFPFVTGRENRVLKIEQRILV